MIDGGVKRIQQSPHPTPRAPPTREMRTSKRTDPAPRSKLVGDDSAGDRRSQSRDLRGQALAGSILQLTHSKVADRERQEDMTLNARDIDFDQVKPIDLNNETVKPASAATPLSTLIWAIASGDLIKVEAQIADDIEWGLMPYNKVLKGKAQVMPWFEAAIADQKEPVVISNAATGDWGVLEYWNIGTVSEEVIKFGNEQKWPWPKNPDSYLGQKYRVAQCFVYHINPDRKIDFMRQYLDTGSVWAQL
jgi:hypothetical protein